MTVFEIANLVIATVGTGAAATGIWYGIHAMVRADKERGAQPRETMDQQREELKRQREAADQRHEEAMAGLHELIRAGQRQGAVLEELLRRTPPVAS